MVVACIGDVHGRVCHALSALLIWQSMRKTPFDLIVQVGDLGVLPVPETGERPYDRFSQWDSAVYDLYDLVMAKGEDADLVRAARAQLATPIYVVAGNHDAFAHLHDSARAEGSVAIDPHGLFRYAPDGFTLKMNREVVGFCEGDNPAYLHEQYSGRLDVLVSHEGGFGIGAEADELSEGPGLLLEYLKTTRPRYHVFGHFHHPVGPRMVHQTRCIQLASVVSNPRDPTLQVMNEGCIGALDTRTDEFEFMGGSWLGNYEREGGVGLLAGALKKIEE